MHLHRRLNPKHCREEGSALPMALGFIILFAVLIGMVFSYLNTGMTATSQLKTERNNLYAVSGAVDGAINAMRANPSLGVGGTTNCGFSGAAVNVGSAQFTCAADANSGQPISTTSAPPFAILALAPYDGSPYSGCSNVHDELGIAQVQSSKLLRVTGNVYVNADVDSDVWSGGCPQTTTAQHIQVTGNAIIRESCHDLDVVQPVPPVTPAYTYACDISNPTAAQTAALADPAFSDPASWAPPFTTPPANQAVPACPANSNVVKFTPGTYSDAAALSSLMNGISCPGRVFWFQPGAYYFNFTNGSTSADHEWRISDPTGKVIGGQPNAVPSGSTPVGPVTVTAANPPAPGTSSPGFVNTGNAVAIGGGLADSQNFNTSNQARWLRLGGYSMATNAIPPGSSTPVVQLHVVHQESWDTTGSAGSQGGYVAGTSSPTVTGTCPTTTPAAPGASTSFCLSASVRAIGGATANALFATTTASTRTITLAGGWTGTALPAGATITSLSARVAHRESSTSGNAAIAPSLSSGAGCSVAVPTNVSNSTLRTDTVALPACFGTNLSALSIAYNAAYTCSTTCPATTTPKSAVLDGIDVTVNYTTPPPATPQFGPIQVDVRNSTDTTTLCTVTLGRTPLNTVVDATLPVPAGCLSQDALNNGTFVLRYTATHAACSSPCQNVDSQLDGMELLVSYSAPGRIAWDPNDPTANPSVPGACRRDGDPFWTDGVQFVFGGDSHVNLQSGQVELCDKPSTTQQEIVLYGVRQATTGSQGGYVAGSAAPSVTGTCPTTVPSGSGSTAFCLSASTLAIGGPTASALFATAASATRTVTLAGGWTGTALPAGATITSLSARVAHRESSTSGNAAIAPTLSSGAGCSVAVPTNVSSSLRTDTVALPACFGTSLSALSIAYNAAYTCSTTCPAIGTPKSAVLDGIDLTVSYSVGAVGSLTPATGCITQAPYYNPQDHSPGFNGACALFKVESDANGGHYPRVAAFWGTVYTPSAALDVPVDVLSVPVFSRGVVARMLMLGYQVASNAQVPITTVPLTGGQPRNRTMTVTGLVPGAPTKVVATVEFCDLGCPGIAQTNPPAVKVYSWQVTR